MISKRPIAFFLLFTFLISYLIGIPFNMFVSGLLNKENEALSALLPRLITVYGPAVAAIIVTWAVAGKEGVKILLKKLRPSGKYLLFSLLIPVILTGLTLFAYHFAGLSLALILQFLEKDWWLLLSQLAFQFLIVGIGEELGWRGWLFPHLLKKNSFLVTVCFVTLVWGLWHFPILFKGFEVVYPWLILLFSTSLIFSWLWVKVKGNVFILAVAHASVNAPLFFIENRMIEARIPSNLITGGWEVIGYTYFLVASVIIIFDYKCLAQNLSCSPRLGGMGEK